MFGLLNINKPTGVTSRDVVNKVQRLIRPVKVGHAGTLDPLATGVLVLCVGSATRLISYVQQMRKRYRGTFLLGRSSDTEDVEGTVVELESPYVPTVDDIDRCLPEFTGTIQQKPPEFSALKVKGKRAYELARAGKQVELEARAIEIFDLKVVSYEYPELVLDIECGSGTYVRSLGRDIGERLGTAAVMSALVRTGIGSFSIEEASGIGWTDRSQLESQLLPAAHAVPSLARVELDDRQLARIRSGQFVEETELEVAGKSGELAAFDGAGELVAILTKRRQGQWGALRNFT